MDASWTKQTGDENAAVGSERDTLISLVNDVKRMIESRDSAALPVAFELLEAWLTAHFKDEAMKAQAANIDFSNRKLEQQFELNGLIFLRDELAAKNGVWSDAKAKLDIQFLSDWLIEHITNKDMQKYKSQACSDSQSTCMAKEAFTQGA